MCGRTEDAKSISLRLRQGIILMYTSVLLQTFKVPKICNAAFHQGLHCLQSQKNLQRNTILGIITYDPRYILLR